MSNTVSSAPAPALPPHRMIEMLQALPCATALADDDGKLRWCNPAMLALLCDAQPQTGVALTDVLGLTPAHRRVVLDALNAATAEASPAAAIRAGAAGAWYRLQVVALADRTRMLSLWPAPPESTERAARLAELLDMAQEFGRFGVWERDLRTLDGRWDRHMYRFWGLPEGEGTPAFEQAVCAVVEEDLPALERAFRESLHRAGDYQHRYRLRALDGTVRHLRSHWSVVEGLDGVPDHAIGIVVDETETWSLARSNSEARDQLALVTDLVTIAVWRTDLATSRMVFSGQIGQLLGVAADAQSIPAQRLQELLHPDDLERNRQAIEEAMNGTDPVDCELRYRHADGQWRHVLTRRTVQRDAQGAASAMLGVALDVSGRVKAERLRMENMRQFELSARAAGIGHWSFSTAAGKAVWSEQTYALHQLDPREEAPVLAQWLERFVHAHDREAVRSRFRNWIKRREPNLEQEMRIVRGDGSVRQVTCHSRLDVGAAGVDLYGVFIDVTERRNAEAALREANERVALAARGAGVGTWEIDTVNNRTVWDEQMWILRGLQPRETVPPWEERLAMLHPHDRAAVDTELHRAIDANGPSAIEFRVLLPDGTWRWLASRSVSLRDAHGKELRRIGVNWDITAARNAIQAREERALAQRESRAKSQFLSRMSHELRTPLNAVLGFTQLLIADGERIAATTRLQRLLQIEAAGQHLVSLINDALDLSSVEGGEIRVSTQPVALRALVDETLPLVEDAARRRGVALHVGALPGSAMADPTRLRQVLLNLLSNAVKYNREGGEVHIDGDGDDDGVRLRVRDTGRGIAASDMPRLFEPFNRLGAEREGIEGTGIGLAIVKALVERMDGAVRVHSTAGEGSLFEVRLRAVDARSPRRAEPVSEPAPRAAPARALRLLYIEDNPVNALIVQELVAQRPQLQLRIAADGQSGLAMAAASQPDLVIIDMQLPDFDGLEVLRRLREQPATCRVPCVALSANAMPADIERALRAGFIDYWTKPLKFELFDAAIRSLLRAGQR